ncbi:MAG: hypothetical protein GY822_14110 [Deltaproteobacteria bacterium]|nr:hypothetical protein [Deltaproteobacteria bacterium]
MTTSDAHSQKHLQPLQQQALALGDRLPGATPGTLAVDPPRQPASLEIIAYSANEMTDLVGLVLHDVKNLRRNFEVCWVNVVGVDDSATLQAIGKEFGIHQLVLEDIQHTNQRPKSEVHGEVLFMVVPMPDDDGQLEQMSILLGKDFVLTFNERPGDCFQVIRRRLQFEHLRLRQSLADYLGYTLVDAIVDRFAPLLDDVHEAIDELDDVHEAIDELEDRILHRARPE